MGGANCIGCQTRGVWNSGACESSTPSGFRVLWSGVDTLEASVPGALKAGVPAFLDKWKGVAQQNDATVALEAGGNYPVGIKPQGLRPWRWVLTGSAFHLRLGVRTSAIAGVRLLSRGLASDGPARCMAGALEALRRYAVIGEPSCSRVDIAADFQGWVPTLEVMAGMVTRADFRPIYPSIDNPQTFQYGRGAVVVRVYDKTAEVAAKPSHWPAVWETLAGYDPLAPVWRVEVQLRTDALRDMRLHSVSDVLDALPSLFAYGLEWASLRVPNPSDATRSRWSLHPYWAALASVVCAGVAARERINTRYSSECADALLPQLIGLAVSASAHLGLLDFAEFEEWFSLAARYHLEQLPGSFSERVLQRQLDIYGEVSPGFFPGCSDLPRCS